VSTSLPGGPVDISQQLHHVLEILSDMPGISVVELLLKIYPADLLGTMKTFKDTLEKFEVKETTNKIHIHSLVPRTSQGKIEVELHGTSASKSNIFRDKSDGVPSLLVPCGPHHDGVTTDGHEQVLIEESDYIPTEVHEDILARMIQSHKTGDFCLVGEKGTGKETLIKRFASLLGYEVETVMLYQDMTSRELLQQLSTLPNGDTTWRTSPLVNAAREGKLALLDGLHPGTLSVLKRLLQDRELSLMDGSRLLSHSHYKATKAFAGLSDEDMAQRCIYPIHPAFRVVGLGEPVISAEGSSQPSWISPEVLTMFQFHHIPPLPIHQERHILENKVPYLPGSIMDSLLGFTHTLRTSSDPTTQSFSSVLSTRQLIRIARRLAAHPSDNLHHVIHKSCLSRFLPQLTREALSKSLKEGCVLPPPSSSLPLPPIEYSHSGEHLVLGSTKTKVKSGHTAAAIVPDILFYDNQEHLRILEDMVKDYSLVEHLLLVGNQGVGKNKIADRFLQLLKRPREYIQLHRDTTVQSLTLQPTVEGGVLRYHDSPDLITYKVIVLE
jgi:MoxR-like ATPase